MLIRDQSDGRDAAFEDALLVFFAVWTVVGHLSFFSGISIRQYWLLAWPLSATGLVIFYARTSARVGVPKQLAAEHPGCRKDLLVWLAILLGVVLTLCLHRPEPDDEFYLGLAVTALDNPPAQLGSLEVWWSVFPGGYALSSSYEFLRAGFSWLTGVPVLVSYYLVWPAVIAAMAVAFQCRLLKLLGVKSLALALVTFFVVMLAWGDVHRTPPNFGFVRFFQGKGALIWVIIPSALYHWLRFVEFSDRKSLLLLFCSVIAGIGFTPSGVPTGVLLTGLFFAATLIYRGVRRGNWAVVMALACVALYPVIIGVLMKYYFGHTSSGVSLSGVEGGMEIKDSVLNIEIINDVLAHDLRGRVAIFCSVTLPLFLRSSRVKPLFSSYSIVCTLLLVFPWSSELLRIFAYSTFAWRWLFVVPFVLAIVMVVERVCGQFRTPLMRFGIAGTMALVFLSGSTRWVLSEQNYTHLKTPGLKLANENEIFLSTYYATAKIDGLWLISPASGTRY